MEKEENSRRSTRRAVRNRFRVPSAAHYVGYVEDDETPEMIMKKFEELDQIIQTNANAPQSNSDPAPIEENPKGTSTENGENSTGKNETECEADAVEDENLTSILNEEQLAEIFKRTSMFTVKSAMDGNEVLRDGAQQFGDDGGDVFWSDEDFGFSDDEGFWEDEGLVEIEPVKMRARSKKGEGKARKQSYQVMTDTGTGMHLRIRRRAGGQNSDGIIQLRIPPPPIPLSWGRTVQPFGKPKRLAGQNGGAATCDVPESIDSIRYRFPDLTDVDMSMHYRRFIGVLVNPGWEQSGADKEKVSRLSKIPLNRLCPHGFIFIWLKKDCIQPVWALLNSMRYTYVENLTWVMLKPNNHVVLGKRGIARCSHLTLYIFRKAGEGKDIEIRHQRSPDVVVNCVQKGDGVGFRLPDEVYGSLETMLPKGKGKFLELWSERGAARPGWTHMAEVGRS